MAVRYLEEACESPDVLQIVVEMHPTLDHLGEIGHPLLLKLVVSPEANTNCLSCRLMPLGSCLRH